MAYIRGADYLWHDDERVHIWVADGLDHWQDSDWCTNVQSSAPDHGAPSGVAVRQDLADLYVVMRFAELLQEGHVREIVERALRTSGGNGGCLALRALAPQLIRAVDDL